MADRNGSDLRRRLVPADRLRQRATASALSCLKTPSSRSSALLSRVTLADHRFPATEGLRFDFGEGALRVAIHGLDTELRSGTNVSSVPSLKCVNLFHRLLTAGAVEICSATLVCSVSAFRTQDTSGP